MHNPDRLARCMADRSHRLADRSHRLADRSRRLADQFLAVQSSVDPSPSDDDSSDSDGEGPPKKNKSDSPTYTGCPPGWVQHVVEVSCEHFQNCFTVNGPKGKFLNPPLLMIEYKPTISKREKLSKTLSMIKRSHIPGSSIGYMIKK